MQPFTPKSAGVLQAMQAVTGRTRRLGRCTTCDVPQLDFRNALSVKEYAISGMCQRCQDETFGSD